MLAKQAKTLSKRQTALVTALLQQTRYPARNHVILLLSLKAGLRAKEIASLTWDMVTDAEGNLGSAIYLRNEASKGSSGRVIPLNKDLKAALLKLRQQPSNSPYVITTERIAEDVSRCDRQPVRALVSRCWTAGLLQPLWSSHLHHQRSAYDQLCWRLAQGRPDARWSQSAQHHPALH